MVDARKDDSSSALEDLEEGWDIPEADASAPLSLDELDSGWGEDEEEEEEPELPDERLDPIAYAEAKKAREERAAARQKRRRAKMDAKRAKQRARVAAQEKQKKTKKKKPARRESLGPKASSREATAEPAEESSPRIVSEKRESRAMRTDSDAKKRAIPWRIVAIAIVIFLGAAALAGVLFR